MPAWSASAPCWSPLSRRSAASIPLALTGGELWRPLTAVHIFGLLFATALSLVLLPVLYYVFAARWRWIR
jgi:Cu/Ag efflux pump CusA